jgi:hypothetical protein
LTLPLIRSKDHFITSSGQESDNFILRPLITLSTMIFDSILSLSFLVVSLFNDGWHKKPLITSATYQSTVSEHNLFSHAKHLLLFSKLNSTNTRVAGSSGHKATVDYIKSRLDDTGFYDTYLQPFTYTYSRGNATFSTGPTSYQTAWFTYGPAGDVTAPLVIVNNFGCAPVRFKCSYTIIQTLISL